MRKENEGNSYCDSKLTDTCTNERRNEHPIQEQHKYPRLNKYTYYCETRKTVNTRSSFGVLLSNKAKNKLQKWVFWLLCIRFEFLEISEKFLRFTEFSEKRITLRDLPKSEISYGELSFCLIFFLDFPEISVDWLFLRKIISRNFPRTVPYHLSRFQNFQNFWLNDAWFWFFFSGVLNFIVTGQCTIDL